MKITKVWNVVAGCKHLCSYCWARKLVGNDKFTKRIEYNLEHEAFVKGDVVLVATMGDLFGDWVPSEVLKSVANVVNEHPGVEFVFLTKNPDRYDEFTRYLKRKRNVLLGATIETDLPDVAKSVSRAPHVDRRFAALRRLKRRGWRIFVAVEPVLKFSPLFVLLLAALKPEVVIVGFNRNEDVDTPNPGVNEVNELIARLGAMGVRVEVNGRLLGDEK